MTIMTKSKGTKSLVLFTLFLLNSSKSSAQGTTQLGSNVVCTASDDTGYKCQFELDPHRLSDAWGMDCKATDDGKIACQVAMNHGEMKTEELKVEHCSSRTCAVLSLRATLEASISSESMKPPEPPHQDEIQVGSYTYRTPYTQYDNQIAKVLERKPNLPFETLDSLSSLSMANWLLELGQAHSVVAYPNDNLYVSKKEEDLALNSFQVSEKIYLSIVDKDPDVKLGVTGGLATIYFQLGELHQVSSFLENQQEMALHYFRLAHEKYASRIEMEEKSEYESLIGFANTCQRIGYSLMLSVNSISLVESLVDMEMMTDQHLNMEQLLSKTKEAKEKFEEAIRCYRAVLKLENDLDTDLEVTISLASTLMDYSSAVSVSADLTRSTELQEEAIMLYREVLSNGGGRRPKLIAQAIGDGLYVLSNSYLQLARYDECKRTYRESMKWYEDHNIETFSGLTFQEGTDESLLMYEQELASYRERVIEASLPNAGYSAGFGGGPDYMENPLFEADLHAALGAVHFTRNENIVAQDHFEQALRLYLSSPYGEERAIADVKLNIAMLHLSNQEYAMSVAAHEEAIDLYRKTVGEGKNPLTDGLDSIEDLMKELGVEIPKAEESGSETVQNDGLIDIEKYMESIQNLSSLMEEL